MNSVTHTSCMHMVNINYEILLLEMVEVLVFVLHYTSIDSNKSDQTQYIAICIHCFLAISFHKLCNLSQADLYFAGGGEGVNFFRIINYIYPPNWTSFSTISINFVG